MVRKTLTSTGEQVEMTPDQKYERDTAALCGAKHTISVGTTHNPNGLVPFDDYMIVYLKPEDTGGGGHVEDIFVAIATYVVDVGKGSYTAFADPEDYADTTQTGQEIVEQNFQDCLDDPDNTLFGNCKGEWAEATGYTALNYTVGSTTRGLGRMARGCAPWDDNCAETDHSLTAYRAESPFYSPKGQKTALTFGLEDAAINCSDWWKELHGGCYHSGNGGTHKIRITISNEYEGKTTTPYIYDLAGCNASYDAEDKFCPEGEAVKRFLITKPGRWTIKVKPIATATCNALDYEYEWSFDVDKPEDWEPPALHALTDGISEALQEVGLPINVTPLGFVAGCSVIGGLLLTKIWKNKRARRAKKDKEE